jgi:hypothetical protein
VFGAIGAGASGGHGGWSRRRGARFESSLRPRAGAVGRCARIRGAARGACWEFTRGTQRKRACGDGEFWQTGGG